MTAYAVLLRAVNLGSHNKVSMPRLRELAESLGYANVTTYLQSGNLVVDAATKKPGEVESAVRDALQRELGLDIDVMARSRADLAKVVAANPFADRLDDPKKVHVSFLTAEPTKAAKAACDPDEFAPEAFGFGPRCLYLWLPDGAGRSKLATAPWEKRLGVKGTARNWRTVTALVGLLDDLDVE